MIILNKHPVTAPAVAARTFAEIWISGINISLPPGQPGSAGISWYPWDAATDTVHPDATPLSFTVRDLKSLAETDPLFKAAWEAITAWLAAHMTSIGVAGTPEPPE
jgi:hypothetical protein